MKPRVKRGYHTIITNITPGLRDRVTVKVCITNLADLVHVHG